MQLLDIDLKGRLLNLVTRKDPQNLVDLSQVCVTFHSHVVFARAESIR